MGIDRHKRIQWIFVVLALLMSQIAYAEVVVFKNYETSSNLEPDSLHIERHITLQNVGSNPIIPGELHFKLHELRKGEKLGSRVSDFSATNDLSQALKTRKIETSEETDLVVSVWEPVLSKFTYNVKLSYDLSFKPKGIFFYEITVPLEETTIPIKNQKQNLFLPSKYHVTYAPNAVVQTVVKDGNRVRQVTWENREDMVVEYSRLPLPKMGIRGVNVFWIIVILMLLIITFFIHKRLRGH